MIVSHLNTFPYGGAATAALRLHRQMRSDGIDSRFLYSKDDRSSTTMAASQRIEWKPNKNPGNIISRHFEKRRLRKIYSLYDSHLTHRDPSLELFSMAELPESTAIAKKHLDANVFHLHWLAFMVDYPSFFKSIPAGTLVVWTLHDMNPLTGGCHYSSGCDRFVQGCGHCPLVNMSGPHDVSKQGFQVKKTALRQTNLSIVAPSDWMKTLAASSPVFPRDTTFHHIKLGFDLQSLFPMQKQKAREAIGVDSSQILIGFGCESIENPRKGLDLLASALSMLPDKSNIECVVFGSGDLQKLASDYELPKIHNLGFINDKEKLAAFYSACDFVVVPSREDNQPQVGLEAMACGTPVVGFDVGGVGEFVKPGITGWLARKQNANDLSIQIHKLIVDSESRLQMGRRCRQLMQQEFDIIKQSKKYVQLYDRLLENRQRLAA